MATLKVWYDQQPENDLGPGDPAFIVTTEDELTALIDRVNATSAIQPCPSLIEVSITEDPYGFPTLNAGIGHDRGHVRLSGRDELRATRGDSTAAGTGVYDFQGHETLVPVSYEVPPATVRGVLAAFLEHGGKWCGKRPATRSRNSA
ncbi:Imm1 family immunity protein [Actinosynnema sp. NPDC023587]|uniref:Imm1 family immunity protein n=1 Tax=Actinosynnema sp. NPDC023587 TaxID=3154695 RepID=UPI0034004494